MRQRLTNPIVDFQNSEGSALQIKLLGPSEIRLAGHFLAKFGSRKAQALFFYLVMTTGSSTRDTLAALLWPDMDEQSAKNNLRSTLAILKRQIGPYLNVETTEVSFARHLPYQLDVENLHTLVNSTIAGQDLKILKAAIELYQGEFLQGFHIRNAGAFEEWMLQQREQLHLLILQVLETLATSFIERGEYGAGLAAGRRLLALEPWSELAHRQMMRMLAASGQRTQALKQYKLCCQVLADEFSIEPMAETVALYQQIQAGTYVDSLDHLGERLSVPFTTSVKHGSSKPVSIERTPIPHNLTTPLAVFIGRQAELDFINGRLREQACRLLTIVGSGGMGKTSLLDCMTALGEALRLQKKHTQAKSSFLDCRKVARELGAEIHMAPVLWEEGCLAEECGEYVEAKALFTECLAIGLPYWWVHALPTLGWALIELEDLEEANTYFQKVLNDAEAQSRLPVALDAQAGLAYIRALLARGSHGATNRETFAEVAELFRHICQHPPATQQTRERVVKIASQMNIEVSKSSQILAEVEQKAPHGPS
ncbi:MAG: BTAD domain-containing putative transcriptional regulator [Chloroflexota bacterium]